MSITALGDIHGRNIWKKILAQDDSEKVVFIGDYFDSHEGISPEEQIINFQDILRFKAQSPQHVILIIGNHDFHYLDVNKSPYSGFQSAYAQKIGSILQQAIDKDLMQMCFAQETLLFTHAGVTQTWCETHNVDQKDIEKSINSLFQTNPAAFEFTPGPRRDPTGDETTQSPIWVRPQSLRKDKLRNYTQIVGHTIQDGLVLQEDIILIDTLGTSREYLYIGMNAFEVKKSG